MSESDPLRRPTGSSPEEAESGEDGVIDPESNVAAFRISVDLSEYFKHRASCYLWVPRPRETITVRWLARRLRQLAALRERFCLLCGIHVLPPDEPLRLLQPGDSLRVVRVTHEWQRVFSFKGDRAPPAPPPKAKTRHKIDAVPTEPTAPAPVPRTKPTQKLASTPKEKPSLPPPTPLLSPVSLPTPTPAVPLPPSVQSTTFPKTKSPSQDEELQRVKRCALALLQKVEGEFGEFSRGHQRERGGGEDETDGAGNGWPPAKKRRHRVRRRRALPPIDFEQELLLSTTKSSNSEQSMTPAIPITPATTVLESHSIPTPYLTQSSILSSPVIPAPSLPRQPSILPSSAYPAASFPTQPSILGSPSISMPSLSLAPPSGPVVLRGETTPRLPRVIRALDATRSEDIGQASQELSASTAPAPLPQTAVQCR